MKRFILLILLSSLSSNAKIIGYTIQGNVKNTTHAKFAYLSTLSQNRTISSPEIFMKIPIKKGKFTFNGSFDLDDKDFQYACVFIDDRDNITKEELTSKFEQLIWVTGRDNNLRQIILEDLILDIEDQNKMKVAKVIEGGLLTKQEDELSIALKAKNRKLLDFVKKYPDSPVSFRAVSETTSLFELSNKEKYESMRGTPLELYALLSKRLHNSKRGIALKKKIHEIYNP